MEHKATPDITFITGNQAKANLFAKYLGIAVKHHKLDLDEIQSLSLRAVAGHKARQAYAILQRPVLIDDSSLEFSALGRLPGTFIKFFQQEMTLEELCRLLDGKDRSATARTVLAYCDGTATEFFEASVSGTIAGHPTGSGGFGWDSIFIADGAGLTNASLDEAAYEAYYKQMRAVGALRDYIERL